MVRIGIPIKSFNLKIVNLDQQYLMYFKTLILKYSQQLLNELWSEKWLDEFEENKGIRAYEVIQTANPQFVLNGKTIYLPSRIKRGIFEYVGRIIRSFVKLRACFYDCLQVMELVGYDYSLNRLYPLIRDSYRNSNGVPNHKKIIVMKVIKLIRKWYYHLALDFTMIPFSYLIQPNIKQFTFLYHCDDANAIRYRINSHSINYKIKLPIIQNPVKRQDWQWFEDELPIPKKIQLKIQKLNNRESIKPTLITKILKGGLEYFFLIFPWSYEKSKHALKSTKDRMLSIDLGIKKLATGVVCEAGNQISRPIIIKQVSSLTKEINRLYNHISGITSKLRKLKNNDNTNSYQQRLLEIEHNRLYNKRNRIQNQLVHIVTNKLILLASKWQCSTILLEDLRTYVPRRGKRKTSRRQNDWFRGKLLKILKYKCREVNINVQTVSPYGTSCHCSRCGNKDGLKIKGPNNLIQSKKGRWFYCSECGFSADRDYNAALNIYRAREIDYESIPSLVHTQPIPSPYTELGTPLNRPSGGTVTLSTNEIVEVVGG